MPSPQPFAPNCGSTQGKTVKVTANNTPTSVPGSIDCSAAPAPHLLVNNNGTVLVFVRMSPEATPVATAADVPLRAGESRVFTNPKPFGVTGLAVLSSTTTTCDVYFSPGDGGL